MIKPYSSWGRYPESSPKNVKKYFFLEDIKNLNKIEGYVLPFGLGRSYGDSCLNNGETILDCSRLNRAISFDKETGIFRGAAGISLSEILDIIVPYGWFLPVTPGTKFVTLGGAIANDVHGKNHHVAGTFGRFVRKFEIMRSDGSKTICSPNENTDLFRATIGGLGLTGVILWAEISLKKVESSYIDMESEKYGNLEDFFALAEESKNIEYTVSWIDCSASGKNLGRGIFLRGDHAPKLDKKPTSSKPPIMFPFDAPFINGLSVSIFNKLYYAKQLTKFKKARTHYNPFFYPLDAVGEWNKAYGKKGFLQYQFVMPFESDRRAIREALEKIAKSGLYSFLVVMKTCGELKSPGMLSFPRPGVTVALDFRMQGQETLKFLEELDQIVKSVGGRLYPAKDARMSEESFHAFYPEFEEFKKFIDPKFSSSFLRRVCSR